MAMEQALREKLVRRITSRTLYGSVKFQNDRYDVIYKDPSLQLLTEADYKYHVVYNTALKEGDVMTLEESYEILKKDGTWSDAKQKELETLYSDIKQLQAKLHTSRFKKAEQRAIKATIDEGRKRIDVLEHTKNQLWGSTIDYLADKTKRHFIISRIVTIVDQSLLSIPLFLDALAVYYYKDASISEKQIREIARTDPWRLYWTVSKNTGTSLFPHSCVEMTELQHALVLWTQIYDFAYQSQSRPSDEVIDDDDQFDAWYRSECKRLEVESKQHALDNGIGGQEVFVPADREGAKEVYELNDAMVKNRIAQRHNVIESKGTVDEANLPDVKQELVMAKNRMAASAIQGRT